MGILLFFFFVNIKHINTNSHKLEFSPPNVKILYMYMYNTILQNILKLFELFTFL